MKKLLFLFLFFTPFSAFAYTITGANFENNGETFGYAVNNSAMTAQSFTTVAAGNLTQVIAGVRLGGGASSVDINIYASSGSAPTGSSLGSATVSAVATCGDTIFTLTPIALSGSTQYFIVFSRNGGYSTGNYLSNCTGTPTTQGYDLRSDNGGASFYVDQTATAFFTATVDTGGGGGGGGSPFAWPDYTNTYYVGFQDFVNQYRAPLVWIFGSLIVVSLVKLVFLIFRGFTIFTKRTRL